MPPKIAPESVSETVVDIALQRLLYLTIGFELRQPSYLLSFYQILTFYADQLPDPRESLRCKTYPVRRWSGMEQIAPHSVGKCFSIPPPPTPPPTLYTLDWASRSIQNLWPPSFRSVQSQHSRVGIMYVCDTDTTTRPHSTPCPFLGQCRAERHCIPQKVGYTVYGTFTLEITWQVEITFVDIPNSEPIRSHSFLSQPVADTSQPTTSRLV